MGYLVDPFDEGDAKHKLSIRLGALAESPPPASASVEQPVPIKDQDMSSSCVGQGISRGCELGYLYLGIPCPELSALDVYARGRAEHGGQHEDVGSYIRSGIKAVQRGGIADEAAWPFSMDRVNRNPNMTARQSAHDRRGVRGYHRIDSGDVAGVRRAIASGFPVVGGWQIDQGFMDWNGNGVISGQIMPIGGHAMCITSYAADGTFRLINSWGASYGRSGYAVVDDMFISAVQDAWAIEVAP